MVVKTYEDGSEITVGQIAGALTITAIVTVVSAGVMEMLINRSENRRAKNAKKHYVND